MGVSVRDTKSEMSTATVTVMPNSKKNLPTMPFMNATGTNTATMDNVVAMTARPISEEPSREACIGGSPFLHPAVDVLEHHDGVVDQNADREGQSEHGHDVQREPKRLDEGKSRDDRRRQGHGADQRASHASEEDKDNEHSQHGPEPERYLDILDRTADELGLVEGDIEMHALRAA